MKDGFYEVGEVIMYTIDLYVQEGQPVRHIYTGTIHSVSDMFSCEDGLYATYVVTGTNDGTRFNHAINHQEIIGLATLEKPMKSMTFLEEVKSILAEKLSEEPTLPDFSSVLEEDFGGDVDKMLRDSAYYGHLDHVRWALKNGADVHKMDDAALRWASSSGHTEIVKLLLENGANVYADGDYALRWASYNGHLEVVDLLKKWMKD